ncbi:hypothetical protein INR49_028367 [Caranx melampygus]|nr:hypothetical protein INR49_028367 [Caranx melampygus]
MGGRGGQHKPVLPLPQSGPRTETCRNCRDNRLGLGGVGLTQHHPACLHHTLTFPHLDDKDRKDEINPAPSSSSQSNVFSLLWVFICTTAKKQRV